MPEIKILYSWNDLGQNRIDHYIAKKIKRGTIQKLSSDDLKQLIEVKNKFLNQNEILNINLINDGKDYYIYYNFHPSSGWQTEFKIKDNGEIQPIVNKPTGMVLQAFWSEVKILEII